MTRVVTSVVLSPTTGKVLFLRRSDKVGTYKGRWSCVSGHVEKGDKSAEERARKELREETGIVDEDIKKLIPAGIQQEGRQQGLGGSRIPRNVKRGKGKRNKTGLGEH